jgi:hypothetical protein
MPPLAKKAFLALAAAALLVSPPVFWLSQTSPSDDPIPALTRYLKFLYARDLPQAYRAISAVDRRLKKQADYVRERGAFTGFALDVTRKLAEFIEIRPISQQIDGPQVRVKVLGKYPDPNAIASLLLDWDEHRLKNVPAPEQKKILTTISNLARAGKLPMIEGEEEFVLVNENSRWKIFLNWAAGVKINFATTVPSEDLIIAEPLSRDTVGHAGDTFTIGFKVKNLSKGELRTRIAHRVDPKELAHHLDLVECALLLPVRLRPGEEQVYNSTYVLRGDLPDTAKTLEVTYEFKIEP